MTSVVAVEVAPDLPLRGAYASACGDKKSPGKIRSRPQSAEGYIRRPARTINMRKMATEIRFIMDQSEYGVNMTKKINDLTKDLKSEE